MAVLAISVAQCTTIYFLRHIASAHRQKKQLLDSCFNVCVATAIALAATRANSAIAPDASLLPHVSASASASLAHCVPLYFLFEFFRFCWNAVPAIGDSLRRQDDLVPLGSSVAAAAIVALCVSLWIAPPLLSAADMDTLAVRALVPGGIGSGLAAGTAAVASESGVLLRTLTVALVSCVAATLFFTRFVNRIVQSDGFGGRSVNSTSVTFAKWTMMACAWFCILIRATGIACRLVFDGTLDSNSMIAQWVMHALRVSTASYQMSVPRLDAVLVPVLHAWLFHPHVCLATFALLACLVMTMVTAAPTNFALDRASLLDLRLSVVELKLAQHDVDVRREVRLSEYFRFWFDL
jgi:hypothetical protein